MRIPMPPPNLDEIGKKLLDDDPKRFMDIMTHEAAANISGEAYLPWDKFRYHTHPENLSIEEWWFVVRNRRNGILRSTSLLDAAGNPFTYALPDEVLRLSEQITKNASGQISMSEQVTNSETRDRYLVSSLMEEAITSSQLEGASTERGVAREMLRSGREPQTVSEKMILNNFRAMRMIGSLRKEKLTPGMICEIHRIVTEGTLENPDASGRFQRPGEERITVRDEQDKLLYKPPPARDLPERIERLCTFANGDTGPGYLPPVLRAITVHFMLGYEHPFEDGNGRTARTLFYWSMLNQGYWLTEFLTVSKILKESPTKYARSYLYAEQDTNDLTYFHIYHLKVVQRAVDQLQSYLTKKMEEVRTLQITLARQPGEFNHRQMAVLNNAANHPNQRYTAVSHATSHGVSGETARKDLLYLEQRGLLSRAKAGKQHAWVPAPNLLEQLDQH